MGRADGWGPGEHAAGQDRQWATQSWKRLRRTNAVVVSSQSVSHHACTLLLLLLLLWTCICCGKRDCIRGWLAERADEWLWAGCRSVVILCALTGRLNLGPGVAGANKPLGNKGTRCFACPGCSTTCKGPRPNQMASTRPKRAHSRPVGSASSPTPAHQWAGVEKALQPQARGWPELGRMS